MKNCSILIIDDNETDRYLLKRLIRKLDTSVEIFEAENGQVAMNFFLSKEENSNKYPDSFPPLMIFLDINMPIMNGFEFLEEFQKLKTSDQSLGSIILTMFTSSEREEDVARVRSYAFVHGHITKGSLTVESLKETIQNRFPKIKFETEE